MEMMMNKNYVEQKTSIYFIFLKIFRCAFQKKMSFDRIAIKKKGKFCFKQKM
jgi:hypothetical protein